jgi:hypothetical protein
MPKVRLCNVCFVHHFFFLYCKIKSAGDFKTINMFHNTICWPCLDIVFRFIIGYSSLRDFGL